MGGHATNDDGFIMVDALTGVVIISLMVGVCLATIKISRSLFETSRDMRASQVLLQSLMETAPRIMGRYKGVSGGLAYEVEVNKVKRGGVRLCEISASVTSTGRPHTYRLDGTRWCMGRAL